ncbi:MAG TPA: glycosyltransferase family 1 protein [Vicinamibacterales bacterium]|nr:glycosyltransferase family 1 protein [Vicinamibacterales bacterium]
MKILVDYRPALRERTGVGEYMHEIIRAYTSAHDDDVAAFTSSWRDRPAPDTASRLGARVIDRRVPVRVLNLLWHRLQWPAVERLAGPFDVVHAAHPLMIPTVRAARIVTVHDLYFLDHPERADAEIRRDYPALTARHARAADAVITPSHYTKALVVSRLGVPAERVYACPFGAPAWRSLGRQPHAPPDGYFLFVGTLVARKNVAALLDAYVRLLTARPDSPRLVIAGAATPDAAASLARLQQPPLAGRVEHRGYVPSDQKESLYAGARALIMPSHDEGFGVPALEAMSAGIPVIASDRGALPEVIGSAGTLLDPGDIDGFAAAMDRVAGDRAWAIAQGEAGLRRAAGFTWRETAVRLRHAYEDAIVRRRGGTPARTGGIA